MDAKPLLTCTTGVPLHERFSRVLVAQSRRIHFNRGEVQVKDKPSPLMLRRQAPPPAARSVLCVRRGRGLSKRLGRRCWTCGYSAPRPPLFWGFMKKYRRFPSVGRRPWDPWRRRPLLRSGKGKAGRNLDLRLGGAVSARGRGYSQRRVPTKRELDKQLDDYMSVSKHRLDADLDDYWSMSKRRLDAELDLYMAMVDDEDRLQVD